MTTSLVTGGCGFIGSHVVDELYSLGHRIIVIDDLSAPENDRFYLHEDKDNTTCHIKDISEDDCGSYFKGVDYVFHLAARSRIQPSIGNSEECFRVNVIGTQRVLEWSRINAVKKIIYSGTSSLYGYQNAIPFSPNMPVDCLNPYSMPKWMGEQICKLYAQLHGVQTVVLRYFNVYGPREPLKGRYAPVIGLFKRQIREGKPITIVGDGSQKRDFTYISDVVNANICAMSLDEPGLKFGIYNVGSGKNYSINQVADMLGKERIYIPARPAEVGETLADIQKTIDELGWSPKFNLREMITSY